MLHVFPLQDDNQKTFAELFADYYNELGCGDDVGHLIDEYIIPDVLAGLIRADLIADGENTVGFIIYQIDEINNEWNLKEGWGDVREIYIKPSCRRQGLGKFLLYTAEMKLKESGADKAYCLPYEGAVSFFTACGYIKTQDYNEELDCTVFEKHSLDNCCKGK